MRARRRRQVSEAEGATSAARKELRALEERHEALAASLLKGNAHMARSAKRAEGLADGADDLDATGNSRQPEELRQELAQKQGDIQAKSDEISSMQEDQDKAEKLLEWYQEERERNEARREKERLEAEESAENLKADILQDVLQNGLTQEDKDMLTQGIKIDVDTANLFEQGADGKWQPSNDLEEILKGIENKKREAEERLAAAEQAKKDAADKKTQLQGAVQAEQTKGQGLDSQVAKLNQQIKEANDKCC